MEPVGGFPLSFNAASTHLYPPMDIVDNPFHKLGATPRDSKGRLYELSEAMALKENADAIVAARNALLHPRKRLEAEVAWFPGMNPSSVYAILGQLYNMPNEVPLAGIPNLCKANFLSAGMAAATKLETKALKNIIERLAWAVDCINVVDVMREVNEDRQLSGFPPVKDASVVEAELASRRRHYQRACTALLDSLPSREMASTYECLVGETNSDGDQEAPQLINDLIDTYELRSKTALDAKTAAIESQIKKICVYVGGKDIPASHIHALVRELENLIRTWSAIAQPIQLDRRGKGLDHEVSTGIGLKVRNLAIDLFNAHDLLDDASSLCHTVAELFIYIPTVAERIAIDVVALGKISQRRRQHTEGAEKKPDGFDRSVAYETTLGPMNKRLAISTNGIEWDNQVIEFSSITAVRWGSIRRSKNGVDMGITHYFHYNTASDHFEFNTWDTSKFDAITSRMWRAVCIRIMQIMMKTWREGEGVYFGNVEVRDRGVVLRRKRPFRQDEKSFYSWQQISKWNANGVMKMTANTDKRFAAELNYLQCDNVHILSFVIDNVLSRGADCLSRALYQGE